MERYNYIKDLRSKVGHMPILYSCSALIIYNDNGKVLLQKRADNGRWAVHGGGIDLGEKVIDALYREIKEELNIVPINPKFMGIYSGKEIYNKYPNGDEVYIICNVFVCKEFEGNIEFHDKEVSEVKWFDLDNLPENLHEVDRPYISDLKKFIENEKVIIN